MRAQTVCQHTSSRSRSNNEVISLVVHERFLLSVGEAIRLSFFRLM
jgi:hypothetical protein